MSNQFDNRVRQSHVLMRKVQQNIKKLVFEPGENYNPETLQKLQKHISDTSDYLALLISLNKKKASAETG